MAQLSDHATEGASPLIGGQIGLADRHVARPMKIGIEGTNICIMC